MHYSTLKVNRAITESDLHPLTLKFVHQFNISLQLLGDFVPNLCIDPTGRFPFTFRRNLAFFENLMAPPIDSTAWRNSSRPSWEPGYRIATGFDDGPTPFLISSLSALALPSP